MFPLNIGLSLNYTSTPLQPRRLYSSIQCAALPLASSSGPLDRLFRARPSATLQANLGHTSNGPARSRERRRRVPDPRDVFASPPRYNWGIQATVELPSIHHKAFRKQ
jgi:hypothetical protein